MESLFSGSYHPVRVTEVQYPAGHLKKIRFEGDFSKISRPFIPGNVIEFRISDTEFRHYTPSFFDPAGGECEVWFYLHGKGPGSRWVEKLREGDALKLLGPGGKLRFDDQADRHLCFGDETSLGLLKCISEEASRRNSACRCIAELDTAHREWPGLLELNCISVSKNPVTIAGESMNRIDEWLTGNGADPSGTAFYLTGNAKSIQTLKKHLLDKGFQNKRIHTEPYWAEGKAGL